MIDKNEAEGLGMRTEERSIERRRNALLSQLQSIAPSVINADGQLNVSALKDELGEENIVTNSSGYGLQFAGKSLARAKGDTPTAKELRAEREQSKNFDSTENIIIRGDNIDALKLLRGSYYEKVKMIYIDPPYNTDSANFVYKDSFKLSERELIETFDLPEDSIHFFENLYGSKTHSGWLFAMYPRLRLARDLLRQDGVIFISIGDNEQANLKLLADEIFGEQNFVSCLHVEMSTTQGMKVASALKNEIVKNGEHILVYCKNTSKKQFTDTLYVSKEWDTHYSIYYNKQTGEKTSLFEHLQSKKAQLGVSLPFQAQDIAQLYANTETVKKYIHEQAQNIYQDAMCDIHLDLSEEQRNSLESGEIVSYMHEGKKEYLLKMTNTTTIRQLLPLDLAIGQTDDFNPSFGTRKIRGDWWAGYYKDMMNINKEGNIIYKNGKKPVRLIKDILKITTEADDIVLDFFAGSGTTAQAVMELNKEDAGTRKFILVQWDEEIDPKTNKASHDFCTQHNLEPVISSICIERVNRAGNAILNGQARELVQAPIDIGYKVFSLCDRPALVESGDNQIELKSHRQSLEDTLYNLILTSGYASLSDPIEEIEANLLYKVNDAYFVLGPCATNLEQFSDKRIFVNAYADFPLHSWFSTVGLADSSDNSNVKVLY